MSGLGQVRFGDAEHRTRPSRLARGSIAAAALASEPGAALRGRKAEEEGGVGSGRQELGWLDAIGAGSVDVLVSNPPYVRADDPHLAALRHEPIHALASGADGLDAIRLIVAGAPRVLRPGGALLLEHGRDQGEAVRALCASAGLGEAFTRSDLAGWTG